jgi:hypothetical protein
MAVLSQALRARGQLDEDQITGRRDGENASAGSLFAMRRPEEIRLTRPIMTAAGIALTLAIEGALAQGLPTVEPNGELIYKTYCIGCHTTEVHWREKRLATDWGSLKFQVRRWLSNNGIGLSEDEISALTGYLNRMYYNFPVAIAGYQRSTRLTDTTGTGGPGRRG